MKSKFKKTNKKFSSKFYITLAASCFVFSVPFVLTSCKSLRKASYVSSAASETETYTVSVVSDKVTSPVDEYVVSYGEIINLPFYIGEEVDGYRLDGWYLDENYETSFDGKFVYNSNISVYARWEKIVYTITFVTNSYVTYEPLTLAPGEALTLPTPEMEGYKFEGWYTTEACRNGSEFTSTVMGNTSRTLYAKWVLNVKIISFVTNSETSLTPLTVESGKEFVLPTPTRYTYTFVGWYRDKDLSVPFEDTTVNESLTLYAKWERSSYTLSFVSSVEAVDSISETADTKFDLPEPQNKYYYFLGWYKEAECINKVDFSNYSLTDKDEILYALWVEKKFRLKFVTGTDEVIEDYILKIDEEIPDLPTLTQGYVTFSGWYKDEAGLYPFTQETMGESDITIYAKWPKGTYTLTVKNGDDVLDTLVYSIYDTFVLKEYSKDGYYFDGLYLDENYERSADELDHLIFNTTIYAKLVPYVYTIQYYDGDSLYAVCPCTIDAIPSLENAESNQYRTFVAWYADKDLTTLVSSLTRDDLLSLTVTDKVPEAIKLYAKFKQTYTVRMYYNGGEILESLSFNEDNIPSLPNPDPVGINEFSAWYTDEGLTSPITSIDKEFLDNVIVEDGVAKDICLYAKYVSMYYVENNVLTGISSTLLSSDILNIPSEVNGQTITALGSSFLPSSNNFETINIPSTVTSIGEGAFASSHITSVTLPTYLETMGANCFASCSELEKVVFLGANISAIPDYAFSSCTSLTDISLPYRSLLTIGAHAFDGCTSLGDTDLDECALLTSIGEAAFKGCVLLNSDEKNNKLVIPEMVQTIGKEAFKGCTGITNVTFNGSEITSLGAGAFDGDTAISKFCISSLSILFNIKFGDYLSSNPAYYAKEYDDMVGNAYTTLSVPEGKTSIDNAIFCGLTKITKLVLPSSFTTLTSTCGTLMTSVEEIDEYGLTSIQKGGIKSFTSLKIFNIYDIAKWCSCTITDIEDAPTYRSSCKLYYNGALLENLVVPDGVSKINAYTFCRDSSLKSITMGKDVASIMDSAFSNLNYTDKTTARTLSLNEGLVWIYQNAFEYNNFTEINFPSTLYGICEYAFYNSTGVTSLDFSGVSELYSICDYAFAECTNLTSLTLPTSEWFTTIEEGSFYNSTSKLTSLVLPENICELETRGLGQSAYTEGTLKSVFFAGEMSQFYDNSFENTNIIRIYHLSKYSPYSFLYSYDTGLDLSNVSFISDGITTAEDYYAAEAKIKAREEESNS